MATSGIKSTIGRRPRDVAFRPERVTLRDSDAARASDWIINDIQISSVSMFAGRPAHRSIRPRHASSRINVLGDEVREIAVLRDPRWPGGERMFDRELVRMLEDFSPWIRGEMMASGVLVMRLV